MDVARFALRRFSAAPSRWLPGAIGLGAAFAGLMIALVAPTVAGDVAIRRQLSGEAIGDRSVTVVSTDGARGSQTDIDTYVRGLLHDRGLNDAVRLTAMMQLPTPDGGVFRLVGVDDLASAVDIVDGRLPKRCDADVCEGVLWTRNKAPAAVALDPAVRVTIVGTVVRADDRVLSGTFTPEDRDAVVFVDGAASLANIDGLAAVDRTTGWVAAIDPGRLTLAQVPTFLRQLATLGARNDVAHLVVTAPDTTVEAVARRARITVNRMAVPVGQASAMLAGFAMIMTFAVRPWHRRGLQVLRLRCSTTAEEWRFCVAEASMLVVAGAVSGVALGVVGVVGLGRAAHLGAGAALADLMHWRVLGPFVALLLVALAATSAILRSSGVTTRTRRTVRASDVVGVAAVGVWWLAANRGRATSTTLATDADPLLSITPALACIAAASIAIRFLPMLSNLLKRIIPARSWTARLAVVDAPRRRARALSTAAFVTASLTMATFALGYRATLQSGSVDQAGFAVPLDVTLREGPKLISPQHVRSPAVWSEQITGVDATNVLRRGMSVRRAGVAADPVEVLGVAPAALDELRTWRDDFGPRPRPTAIAMTTPSPSGADLNGSAGFVTLTTTPFPAGIEAGMVLERADGTWHETIATPDETRTHWTMELNPFDQDVRLQGFRIGELHSESPGGAADASVSTLDVVLESVAMGGNPVPVEWATSWSAGATVDAPEGGSGAHITTVIRGTTDLIFFGRRFDEPLPAIVDPLTASTATDGIVTLEVGSTGTLRARVAGIATTFPTVGSRFAVVDEAALSAQLDRIQPGTGAPSEMWLGADNADARGRLLSALTATEFDDIDRVVRTQVESQLSGDTLGRSVMLAFLISSLVSALLGAVALVYVAHSDRLDDSDVLRGLRTTGASARQLASLLRMRCLVLLVGATPVGVACGVVLLDAVRDLISVTAAGTTPVPPLRVVSDLPLITVVVAGVALVSVAGTAWVGRSMRSISRHDSLAAHE